MNVENSMTGMVRGGGCPVPEDLFLLLKLTEEDTTALEVRALGAIGEYADETRESLTVLGEENRKRGDEITALKSELCRLNMIHQKELQAAREEASFLKGRVTTLEQEMTESAEKADVQMRALVEEKKEAVEAAIKSGEAKAEAALKEAEFFRLQVEQGRIETGRQVALAIKERDAVAVAETQKLQGEIASLQQKEKTKSDRLDALIKGISCQKEGVKRFFSWYTTLFDATFDHLVNVAGWVPHEDAKKKLEKIINERVSRMGLCETPILQDTDSQKLKEVVKALIPATASSDVWFSTQIGIGCKKIQNEIVTAIGK